MATFTYGGDPAADPKDAVRFLVGDTAAPWLLCDEEYNYLIAEHGSALAAAAAAADALCAKFSREVDELSGDLQRKCSQKAKAYGELAGKLRQQASSPLNTSPIAYGGGISCADIQSNEEDLDRFPDTFNIGETDSKDGLGLKSESDLRN